jgi:hypothetical protein
MNEENLDIKIPTRLPRSLPEITMFRGDQFMINLIKIHDSPNCQKILSHFRLRTLALKKNDATYRVVSHWDDLGLLECERGSEKGWRRFNLIERLWVQVIIQLRKIGLSLEQIKLSKPFFFEQISSRSLFSYAEYYCLSAFVLGRPVKLLILEDGQAEFLDHSELNGIEEWTSLRHFISLSVNQLLSTMLNKSLNVKYPLEREVSLYQHEICDLMDSEDFDVLKIVKNGNRVTGFEYQKTFSGKVPEQELTDSYSNYEIRKKVVDGHVTSRTRTVRKSTKAKKQ